MKLTAKLLKKLIKEQLTEMYSGKKKIIIAPQMERPPGERYSWEEPGSYFHIPESPYEDLHPDVQAKFPEDAPDQALTQAYDLSSALGHEPQDKKVEDFLQGIKDYGNIDLPRQEAIEAFEKYISEKKKEAMALPSGERSAAIQTIRALNARLSTLKRSKTTKDVHNQTPFGKKRR